LLILRKSVIRHTQDADQTSILDNRKAADLPLDPDSGSPPWAFLAGWRTCDARDNYRES
jgi:hypothetical protein